jgi:hypothetical protein
LTEIQIDYTPDRLTKIAEMDDPSNIEELVEIGWPAPARRVNSSHFRANLDSD